MLLLDEHWTADEASFLVTRLEDRGGQRFIMATHLLAEHYAFDAEATAHERGRAPGPLSAKELVEAMKVQNNPPGFTREEVEKVAGDLERMRNEPATPHIDSRCARCGGPVLLVSCAREGGCRTAEERVAVRERLAKITCSVARGEKEWTVSDGVVTGHGPCTGFGELGFGHALAAWREKALAAERGR
jgi:hypothetical protein